MNEAIRAAVATSFARTASSENHTAATTPRPREIPYSAAGLSWRYAAHRATSRAAGSTMSCATAPSLFGPASSTRTVTPRRVSSLTSAPAAAGAASVAASDSAARASASRSGVSTMSAPPAPTFTPVKAAVPPAPSNLARISSGTAFAHADQDALAGGPRRGSDGQQAGPGPVRHIYPAHAQGGKLTAQPRVCLARED